MAKSGLLGPYPLEEKYIVRFVANSADWSSASVFALGEITNKKFVIKKVCHADGDLSMALKSYMGTYEAFRFRFYRSTRSAFNKQCQLYHQFSPSDNLEHPTRPINTRFTCPDPSCILSG